MGIYLPNMTMPVDCKECPFAGRGKVAGIIELIVCELTNGYRATLINGRMESCPLIELPPHGRLIDADALVYDEYEKTWLVHSAPTIIEAEPPKEE